jgi:hypothetical protein
MLIATADPVSRRILYARFHIPVLSTMSLTRIDQLPNESHPERWKTDDWSDAGL